MGQTSHFIFMIAVMYEQIDNYKTKVFSNIFNIMYS